MCIEGSTQGNPNILSCPDIITQVPVYLSAQLTPNISCQALPPTKAILLTYLHITHNNGIGKYHVRLSKIT